MNYYDILGVSKNATDAEIKSAYKKLARQHHPDRGGDSEKFKEINEANEILSDPEKRRYYDRKGTMENFGQPDIEDMFSGFGDFFRRAEPRHPAGQTIQIKASLSAEEFFNGCTKTFKVKRKIRCDKCHGTGGDSHKCSHCNGTGMIMEMKQFGPGSYMQMSKPCPYCNGSGKEFTKKCLDCHGSGFKEITEEITVSFPKKVHQGEIQTFIGKGYESFDPKGKTGDLIIVPIYEFDSIYNFDGRIFIHNIHIPYYDLILGTTTEITLADGNKQSITIPAKNSNLIKVKNFGEIEYYINTNIVYPISNDKEIELLKQIRELYK